MTSQRPTGPGWATGNLKPTTVTRVFYYILVYTVASLDTQCIDSNLESVRYVSRVGRARGFSLSLGTIIGTYGTLYLRYRSTSTYRVPQYKESMMSVPEPAS